MSRDRTLVLQLNLLESPFSGETVGNLERSAALHPSDCSMIRGHQRTMLWDMSQKVRFDQLLSKKKTISPARLSTSRSNPLFSLS